MLLCLVLNILLIDLNISRVKHGNYLNSLKSIVLKIYFIVLKQKQINLYNIDNLNGEVSATPLTSPQQLSIPLKLSDKE